MTELLVQNDDIPGFRKIPEIAKTGVNYCYFNIVGYSNPFPCLFHWQKKLHVKSCIITPEASCLYFSIGIFWVAMLSID